MYPPGIIREDEQRKLAELGPQPVFRSQIIFRRADAVIKSRRWIRDVISPAHVNRDRKGVGHFISHGGVRTAQRLTEAEFGPNHAFDACEIFRTLPIAL